LKIEILGVWHIQHERILEEVERIKPDAILFESKREDDKIYTWNNFKTDPLFMISWPIHDAARRLPFFKVKDYSAVEKVKEKYKIPVHQIDLNISDIFRAGSRWYNYLVFICIAAAIWLYIFAFGIGNILGVVMEIIVTFVFYSWYFISLVDKARNRTMANSSKKIINKYGYKKPLIICGHGHVKGVRKYIK